MAVLVVYWSGGGNTKIMAEKIYEGSRSIDPDTVLKSLEETTVAETLSFDKIIFGCPAMGAETLEEEDFEPFYQAVEKHLTDKKVALFGSYGWGDGEWMVDWEKRVIAHGGNLFCQGLKVNSTPNEAEENVCYQFGVEFAK